MSAALIATQYRLDVAAVARCSSIWFIAGITATILRVRREKKRVASLKICVRPWDQDNGHENPIQLTFKTSRSWIATFQLSLLSSHCRSFISRSLVIVSESSASRYSIAKSSMLYVEFQRVRMSRGIMRRLSSRSSRMANHLGRRMVVESWLRMPSFEAKSHCECSILYSETNSHLC